VTMLQRSPTYVVSRPAEDAIANRLRRWLPDKLAYFLTRWKNVSLGMFFYWLTRKRPQPVAERLIGMVRDELPGFDVETHFTPRYNPWDQRLCLVPDADLFASIREERADVVTDTIASFDETGIALESGAHLDADIIVTATGLKMQLLSGMEVVVDGTVVDMPTTMSYKGMMYSDVPNMASCFGYTNASWTLKADLTSEYVCRLLNHMAAAGVEIATPKRDPDMAEEPWLDFTSGYVQRALAQLPRQGAERPWKVYQNYALDLVTMRYGRIDDGTMTFSNPPGSSWREAAE
jgi:monooxygenase